MSFIHAEEDDIEMEDEGEPHITQQTTHRFPTTPIPTEENDIEMQDKEEVPFTQELTQEFPMTPIQTSPLPNNNPIFSKKSPVSIISNAQAVSREGFFVVFSGDIAVEMKNDNLKFVKSQCRMWVKGFPIGDKKSGSVSRITKGLDPKLSTSLQTLTGVYWDVNELIKWIVNFGSKGGKKSKVTSFRVLFRSHQNCLKKSSLINDIFLKVSEGLSKLEVVGAKNNLGSKRKRRDFENEEAKKKSQKKRVIEREGKDGNSHMCAENARTGITLRKDNLFDRKYENKKHRELLRNIQLIYYPDLQPEDFNIDHLRSIFRDFISRDRRFHHPFLKKPSAALPGIEINVGLKQFFEQIVRSHPVASEIKQSGVDEYRGIFYKPEMIFYIAFICNLSHREIHLLGRMFYENDALENPLVNQLEHDFEIKRLLQSLESYKLFKANLLKQINLYKRVKLREDATGQLIAYQIDTWLAKFYLMSSFENYRSTHPRLNLDEIKYETFESVFEKVVERNGYITPVDVDIDDFDDPEDFERDPGEDDSLDEELDQVPEHFKHRIPITDYFEDEDEVESLHDKFNDETYHDIDVGKNVSEYYDNLIEKLKLEFLEKQSKKSETAQQDDDDVMIIDDDTDDVSEFLAPNTPPNRPIPVDSGGNVEMLDEDDSNIVDLDADPNITTVDPDGDVEMKGADSGSQSSTTKSEKSFKKPFTKEELFENLKTSNPLSFGVPRAIMIEVKKWHAYNYDPWKKINRRFVYKNSLDSSTVWIEVDIHLALFGGVPDFRKSIWFTWLKMSGEKTSKARQHLPTGISEGGEYYDNIKDVSFELLNEIQKCCDRLSYIDSTGRLHITEVHYIGIKGGASTHYCFGCVQEKYLEWWKIKDPRNYELGSFGQHRKPIFGKLALRKKHNDILHLRIKTVKTDCTFFIYTCIDNGTIGDDVRKYQTFMKNLNSFRVGSADLSNKSPEDLKRFIDSNGYQAPQSGQHLGELSGQELAQAKQIYAQALAGYIDTCEEELREEYEKYMKNIQKTRGHCVRGQTDVHPLVQLQCAFYDWGISVNIVKASLGGGKQISAIGKHFEQILEHVKDTTIDELGRSIQTIIGLEDKDVKTIMDSHRVLQILSKLSPDKDEIDTVCEKKDFTQDGLDGPEGEMYGGMFYYRKYIQMVGHEFNYCHALIHLIFDLKLYGSAGIFSSYSIESMNCTCKKVIKCRTNYSRKEHQEYVLQIIRNLQLSTYVFAKLNFDMLDELKKEKKEKRKKEKENKQNNGTVQ